jgi:membrane-associated protease RseP (regulator of RpoE activity)
VTTVIAFLVALALLIAVHEWGHYRVARACGVKVLRFSIGFGHATTANSSTASTQLAAGPAATMAARWRSGR